MDRPDLPDPGLVADPGEAVAGQAPGAGTIPDDPDARSIGCKYWAISAKGGPMARVEAVIDTNGGKPRIVYWRDLSELGKGFDIQRQ